MQDEVLLDLRKRMSKAVEGGESLKTGSRKDSEVSGVGGSAILRRVIQNED